MQSKQAAQIIAAMSALTASCTDPSFEPATQLSVKLAVLRMIEDQAVEEALARGLDNDAIATILNAVAVGRRDVAFPN